MSSEVIRNVYCPKCSQGIAFKPEAILADNGWIIEYNIDLALFQAKRISAETAEITPDFLFNEGYCTWLGVYPADHIDSVVEKAEIVKLAKVNPKKYLEEIKKRANGRMARLSQEGWWKAQEGKIVLT